MAKLLDIVAGVAVELGIDAKGLEDGGVTIYFEEKMSQENRKKLADQFGGNPQSNANGEIVGIKKSDIRSKIVNGVKTAISTKFPQANINVKVEEDEEDKLVVNLDVMRTPEVEANPTLDPTLIIIQELSSRGLGIDRNLPPPKFGYSHKKEISFNRFFADSEDYDVTEKESVTTFIRQMNLVTPDKDQKAKASKDSFHGRELLGSSATGKTGKTETEPSIEHKKPNLDTTVKYKR